MRTIAIAVLLSMSLMTATTALAPVLDSIGVEAPVDTAAAAPCVLGSDGDCIIPIYCIREPCPHIP